MLRLHVHLIGKLVDDRVEGLPILSEGEGGVNLTVTVSNDELEVLQTVSGSLTGLLSRLLLRQSSRPTMMMT